MSVRKSNNVVCPPVVEILETRAMLSATVEVDFALGGWALVVRGTAAKDAIEVKQENDGLRVKMNGEELGRFDPSNIGRIIVLGGAGDDELKIRETTKTAYLFGEAGNDKLEGAEGSTVAIGGNGNDQIKGSKGRDLLIGGRGKDEIEGDEGDDILIGGYTAYDNAAAGSGIATAHLNLVDLMREWNRVDDNLHADFLARAGNAGDALADGNNTYAYLTSVDTPTVSATVFDDGVCDKLTGKKGFDVFYVSQGNSAIEDSADKLEDFHDDELTVEWFALV